jgi:hypothetical protein
MLESEKVPILAKGRNCFKGGKRICKLIRYRFLETSAKTSQSVELAFLTMASQINARMKTQPTAGGAGANAAAGKGGVSLNSQKVKSNQGCY